MPREARGIGTGLSIKTSLKELNNFIELHKKQAFNARNEQFGHGKYQEVPGCVSVSV